MYTAFFPRSRRKLFHTKIDIYNYCDYCRIRPTIVKYKGKKGKYSLVPMGGSVKDGGRGWKLEKKTREA